LPADPFDPEFSLRIEQCGCLVANEQGDGWSWQFLDANGRAQDIGDPKDKDFGPGSMRPRSSTWNWPTASVRPSRR
jgi:hypothetical protein